MCPTIASTVVGRGLLMVGEGMDGGWHVGVILCFPGFFFSAVGSLGSVWSLEVTREDMLVLEEA